MNNRKLILLFFILVALIQLYVPAKMILGREDILLTGKAFKFKTMPVDPNDPFRGKYITLRFKENLIQVKNENDWVGNEPIYVILKTDKDGYAGIQAVSKVKPADNLYFVKARVEYVTGDSSKNLTVSYPFDRFYMEESKAPEAEKIYRKSLADTNQVTYGLVNIKDGEAVLKDVLINGISINEIGGSKDKSKR